MTGGGGGHSQTNSMGVCGPLPKFRPMLKALCSGFLLMVLSVMKKGAKTALFET